MRLLALCSRLQKIWGPGPNGPSEQSSRKLKILRAASKLLPEACDWQRCDGLADGNISVAHSLTKMRITVDLDTSEIQKATEFLAVLRCSITASCRISFLGSHLRPKAPYLPGTVSVKQVAWHPAECLDCMAGIWQAMPTWMW